jgi:hypothetical protein
MGLILDTSLLIADERGKFDMPGFLLRFPGVQPLITAITASEFLVLLKKLSVVAEGVDERRGHNN